MKRKKKHTELIIGCGNQKNKRLIGLIEGAYQNPTTLDFDPDCKPDVLHDLEVLPLPFKDNSFNEIHAYEVLEHTGQQGDWKFFFAQFTELWRILKPAGCLCGTVPNWHGQWAWGDPSHKRIINRGSLIFLSQKEYEKQIGVTAMTDYRHVYKADFDILHFDAYGPECSAFMLRANKGRKL